VPVGVVPAEARARRVTQPGCLSLNSPGGGTTAAPSPRGWGSPRRRNLPRGAGRGLPTGPGTGEAPCGAGPGTTRNPGPGVGACVLDARLAVRVHAAFLLAGDDDGDLRGVQDVEVKMKPARCFTPGPGGYFGRSPRLREQRSGPRHQRSRRHGAGRVFPRAPPPGDQAHQAGSTNAHNYPRSD
jgi:hypothetical protein